MLEISILGAAGVLHLMLERWGGDDVGVTEMAGALTTFASYVWIVWRALGVVGSSMVAA